MAYIFQNQAQGKVQITDDSETSYTLTGIATGSNDANVLMGGLSIMLDIVGWTVGDVTRVVSQDVVEES